MKSDLRVDRRVQKRPQILDVIGKKLLGHGRSVSLKWPKMSDVIYGHPLANLQYVFTKHKTAYAAKSRFLSSLIQAGSSEY